MPSSIPRQHPRSHPWQLDLLIVLGLMIALTGSALTWGSDEMWIGHALAGIVGFLLLILILLAGASMRGRIHPFAPAQASGIHRIAGLAFVVYAAGTFGLGLASRALMQEPLLGTGHGILGLLLLFLALLQLVPHHLIRTQRLRTLHRVAGYALLPVFLLQMVLGFALSGIFAG